MKTETLSCLVQNHLQHSRQTKGAGKRAFSVGGSTDDINVNREFYVSAAPPIRRQGAALPTFRRESSRRALRLRLGLARAAAAPEVTALASSPGLFRGN